MFNNYRRGISSMNTRIDDILVWKYGPEKGYLWQAGATYDTIDWRCELPMPSKQQLTQDAIDYELYMASIEYRFDRQPLYPQLTEQLDMMYHDLMDGTTKWKDAIT